MLSEIRARQPVSDSASGPDPSSESDGDDDETYMLLRTDSFETHDYDIGYVYT